ncbi:MAG: hypothetical protein C0596_17120 [Marinilabiliales bacterium]|nr:MAG: hypothetical protein C0596_17120 [Marinilabiliales bacterium]
MKSLEENVYDLTTYKSLNTAICLFKKYGWIVTPLPWLMYKALSPEISTEKQVEAAKSLIEAGKENGVKKMRIKLGHKAGIELGSIMKSFPIKLNMGNDGFAEVEVDYTN